MNPEGCLSFGPSGREVTINTASSGGGGGGGVVPADVLWEVGAGTNSIKAKNSGSSTATGTQAVAHGNSNDAGGDYSYTGGGNGNEVVAGATNSVVIGGQSGTITTSTDAGILGGNTGTITGSFRAGILGGNVNKILSNAVNGAIVGGTTGTITASNSAAIVGGNTNKIQTTSINSAIVGGSTGTITTATNAAIIGGSGNSLTSGDNNSVIIGGTNLTATAPNTTYIGKELEVGQASAIGSIKRVSATAINSWEDGNCGNSSVLWFTPADFQGYDINGGRPIATALTDTAGPAWGPVTRTGTRGPGLYNSLISDGELTAMKLLPKGFQTSDQAIFYFAGAPTWISPTPTVGLAVYQTELGTNIFTACGDLSALSYSSPQPVALTAPATGLGTTSIIITLNQAIAIPANEALIGVQVDIIRV